MPANYFTGDEKISKLNSGYALYLQQVQSGGFKLGILLFKEWLGAVSEAEFPTLESVIKAADSSKSQLRRSKPSKAPFRSPLYKRQPHKLSLPI